LQGGFQIRTVGAVPIEPPEPWESERTVYLSVDCANLVNAGSVGQPRDGDPRAAYALYDADRMAVQLRRTAYDIETAQRKILAAGLPELLAYRLSIGS
jgi:diadenosine tetraphosphatase ApaH/serine/threonine PP2A family protein phosphatase